MFFFLLLSAFVALGHWLSRYIPVNLFESLILPLEHGGIVTVCVGGAWLMFRHSDDMRIRRACGYALAAWGIMEVFFICQNYLWDQPVLFIGEDALSAYVLFVCNFLGWLLLIYPTETLRPNWLNGKRVLLQLVPLVALSLLDYLVPLDLRWLVSLYPVVLFIIVLTHIRAYRIWCENNYSSMEYIDAQWIVRYLMMLFVIGASYMYLMISDNPCRAFTQNLLLIFLFGYSIGEILLRKDPWREVLPSNEPDTEEVAMDALPKPKEAEIVQLFEQWFTTEKPYVNPDFKLMDIQKALPINRTYLSQFINKTYGCTFYQYVNTHRIEEAKRLLRERPGRKIDEVATLSGFFSVGVFYHIFTRETGVSPRGWSKNFAKSDDSQ